MRGRLGEETDVTRHQRQVVHQLLVLLVALDGGRAGHVGLVAAVDQGPVSSNWYNMSTQADDIGPQMEEEGEVNER